MDVFTFIILGLLFIISLYVFRKRNKKGIPIPGPRGWPLLGSAFEITEQNLPRKCFEYAEKYGDIVQVRIFNTNIVLLNTLDVLQKAVSADPYKRYFNDRPGFFYGEHFLFGSQGVIVYKEGYKSVHSDLRKIVIQALHVYGDGISVFEDKVQKELDNVLSRIERHGGAEFPFQDQIKTSFSNLLSILLIGESLTEYDPDADLFWEFDRSLIFMYSAKADTVYTTFPFVRYIPGQYRDEYQRIKDCRARILERYYYKTKATRTPGVVRGLVDLLLEEQERQVKAGESLVLTEERLQGIVLEIIAAAIVATLCSESAIMLCLLNNPEWQTRVQKELDEVIGRERRPRLDDREHCPVLEAVAMEAQRLITVIPLGGPHFCRENIAFEGYDVPANTLVLPNLEYIHHNEAVWGPDAWEFRPERFMDDTGGLLPRDHPRRRNWIPFSLGRRQCLGDTFARSRLFLYTATLLQRWSFRPSPGRCGLCDPRKGRFEVNLAQRPEEFYCSVVER